MKSESEGMPTEPNIIKALRITAPGSGWMDVINYIDALRSRLAEVLRERDEALLDRDELLMK